MIKRFCDRCKKEIDLGEDEYNAQFYSNSGMALYELCVSCTEKYYDWLKEGDVKQWIKKHVF